MTGRLLTARELADLLGMQTWTLLDWVRQGKAPPSFRMPSNQLLSVIEGAILRWIGDGCCCAADISEGVGLEPRTMGARLHGLRLRGLVVWEGPRHRRSWRLTDAGRAEVLG